MLVFRQKKLFIQGKNHARLLSLLITKGTIISWHHLVHFRVVHVISKTSPSLLVCRSRGPKGGPAPAFSRPRKPFLLGAPSRRLLNPWHLLLPWPPVHRTKIKKSRPIFQTCLSKRKGGERAPEAGRLAEGGACGPGSAAQPRGAVHLTSRCWAPDPLQPLFTAPLWINPLSVRPEMLSGRQACVASHVSRLLWYTLSPLILSDAPWRLRPSQPRD